MTDVDGLIRDARKARVQESVFPLHTRMLNALEAQQSRIRDLETDRDEFLEQRNEYIGFEEKARSERDALAAVIEKAKRLVPIDTAAAYGALDAAPSDVLREHDAEVWDEGRNSVWAEFNMDFAHRFGHWENDKRRNDIRHWVEVPHVQNPYRTEKPEDER